MIAIIVLGFVLAIIFPIVLAWVVGLVWGGLTKIPVAGKIITTGLAGIIGAFLGVLPLMFAYVFFREIGFVPSLIFIIGAGLLVAVWYFFWHHEQVKEMGMIMFSLHLKIMFMIFYYGSIASGIVAMFNKNVGAILVFACILAGLISYIVSTKGWSGKECPGFKFRWIAIAVAVAVAVGLTALCIIPLQAAIKIGEENTAKNEVGIVTAKTAKNKNKIQITEKFAQGNEMFINTHGIHSLYEDANLSSKVVMELKNKSGEKLISNGEVLFDPVSKSVSFIPISYNGVNAWIRTGSVDTVIGIATVVSNTAVFRPAKTYDKDDKVVYPQSVTLKKGDTFEVLSIDKKRKTTEGIYNGTLGSVSSSDITVAKGR